MFISATRANSRYFLVHITSGISDIYREHFITEITCLILRFKFHSVSKMVNVGLVQMSCTANPKENLDKAITKVREAAAKEA